MKLVDVNLLLYSVNTDVVQHSAARAWWHSALAGSETIGLPWAVLLAFVRISTNQNVYKSALTLDEALQHVDAWLKRPCVQILQPPPDHWLKIQELLKTIGSGGNWVSDAHLAALALENDAELQTADNDFARFPGLRWNNPLAGTN